METLKGGNAYRPLVSYSLYVFILIVFVNISMLNVEEKEHILLFLWIYSIEEIESKLRREEVDIRCRILG